VLAEVEQLARELQPVVSDLQTVSRNARAASAEFADPTGLATRLIDPQGSIKTILNDQNELYNRITSIMSELERTSAELSALTTYLSDQRPELTTILNEGRQTLKTGTDVLESIRSNPLIRGGVPAPVQPETGARGLREPSF
jgi:phospholipid/cholesterol/gamma-HCH transport system substrate-binding protein